VSQFHGRLDCGIVRPMRPLVLGLSLLALAPAGVRAQQADMAAIARWTAAKVVHYRMAGVFRGDENVADDEPAATATVSDRLVLEFDWDVAAGKVVGEPTIENVDSTLKDLRNIAPTCPAPELKGIYEHFTAKTVTGAGGPIEVAGTRSFPEAVVTAGCHGVWERRTVRAREVDATLRLVVPAPMMVAMPPGANPKVAISDDKASFTMADGPWTWTYTPTLVR
jgi:hypothetical protein